MNPRWVARFARWAAAAALLAAVGVAALFVRRSQLAARAARHGPAAVPPSVAQQSLEFTFSKVEGRQTVFTVRAARATEYRGKSQSLLEDVDIIVYGRHGERHDEIHTHSCDYVPATGGVACRGPVEMDLTNVPGPDRGLVPAGAISVETSNLSFDAKTGEVSTPAPLRFRFPSGKGSAVGFAYFSRQSNLLLLHNVDLALATDRPRGTPIEIDAAALDYDRSSGQMRLAGPARIVQGIRSLDAAALTLDLDGQFRPRRALATGRGSRVRMAQDGAGAGRGPGGVQADRVEILFDAQGRAGSIHAAGRVVAEQTGAGGAARLESDRLVLVLGPKLQEAREVQADGSVAFASNRPGQSSQLNTASLRLWLVPGSRVGATRLDRAESPGAANAIWNSPQEQLRLAAGRLTATFDAGNQLRRIDGAQGVRVERHLGAAPPIVTSADSLTVNFAGSQWHDAEESGGVRARQGSREATGDRALWARGSGNVTLSGDARLSDPTAQTLADRIDWDQQTGDLRASGRVRSSYIGAAAGVMPAAGPANLIAQTLDAHPSSGVAVYSGAARMWQADVLIEADRIALDRASGGFTAEGNVRAAFPQASSKGAPVFWRVRAKRLTYANQTQAPAGIGSPAASGGERPSGLATLDGPVAALSSMGQIDAQRMELIFRRDAQGRAELAQAVGRGGVVVRQGQRWGEAEQGRYTAATGKFVLSGGHPSLHDAAGDLVTGDELTFSVADDTILVESAEGSRTSIRHPVQK
ncbi:MAG TPA: hypothetical protein VGS20_06490 [Candidatus Acidoferrales bacterium]|nr:hypothetical protein [Candidatus Acidoferrales bacterium]